MSVVELTSIEEIDSFIEINPLSMLYVSQEDCNVCHAIYPKLKTMLKLYPKLALARVNASQVEEITGRFLIFSVPTILIFLDGREYLREGRFVQFEQLKKQLQLLSDEV
ncbi:MULTISPECIES: thioredoxin family protein [Paenibacillus]|uniref:Thiol-disulfide isomerase-like thioredoxin n=1 Tax=Paenibacillus polymyxa TaxID=1406 RepID=A0A0F6EMB8_PAEPO|nr:MULTISPECIES: thioredoxin family protein [Paenibacillus]AHM66170.1 thiol-disulfide isomerase-like thioredoxin [Paenibacillus polymyxa SQR-21]AIY07132.1 thioredoxin [Paenibacillus polymyxa]KAF6580452.1 thioredoxin family protein [Paenibacillus sp. EKM211P]MBE7899658.1 thioredoxin family protein [Paenibacillus polymyxa]MBG9765144.1 thioredoxin [Paenibacillus polymyxa]